MATIAKIGVACFFHVCDFLTGLVKGVKQKNISSSKMRDGLFKKCGYLILYIVCYMIDKYGTDIGLNLSFHTLTPVICYAVITEIISILENVHGINPDIIPEKILEILKLDYGNEMAEDRKIQTLENKKTPEQLAVNGMTFEVTIKGVDSDGKDD